MPLYDIAMLLSLDAAQASIQIYSPIVFTEWFNTSTRLGPPLQICTQDCAIMVRRCDRVLVWVQNSIIANPTKGEVILAAPKGGAPQVAAHMMRPMM